MGFFNPLGAALLLVALFALSDSVALKGLGQSQGAVEEKMIPAGRIQDFGQVAWTLKRLMCQQRGRVAMRSCTGVVRSCLGLTPMTRTGRAACSNLESRESQSPRRFSYISF